MATAVTLPAGFELEDMMAPAAAPAPATALPPGFELEAAPAAAPSAALPPGFELEEPAANDGPDEITARDFLVGMANAGRDVQRGAGWLLDKIVPDEGFSRELLNTGRAVMDAQALQGEEQLSPAYKEARSREFVQQVDPDAPWYDPTNYEFGDATPATVAIGAAESLPGTAAGMGLGGVLARTFSLVPKLAPAVANALGFGAGEGVVSAASSGQQVEQKVRSMPLERLQESPEFQAALREAGNEADAREVVARAAGGDAAALAGLTSAILGAPSGLVFGRVLDGLPLATSRGRSIATGAAGEAGQEFAQSGAEQLAQNVAIQQNADPNQQLGDGVLNASVGGMASGGLLGGAVGTMSPLQQPAAAPPARPEMSAAAPQQQAPAAAVDVTASAAPPALDLPSESAPAGYAPQELAPPAQVDLTQDLERQQLDAEIAALERVVADDRAAAKAQRHAEIDAAYAQRDAELPGAPDEVTMAVDNARTPLAYVAGRVRPKLDALDQKVQRDALARQRPANPAMAIAMERAIEDRSRKRAKARSQMEFGKATDSPPAQFGAAASPRMIKADQDDILTAVAKAGGLNREEAEAQGIDPASFSVRRGFGQPVFRKGGGRSFDEMAEHLSQLGYTPADAYTANDLLDRVDRSLRGEWVGTAEGTAARAERQARGAEIDRALQEDDEAAAAAVSGIDPLEGETGGDVLLARAYGEALGAGVSSAAIARALGTGDVDVAEAVATLRRLTREHEDEGEHGSSPRDREAADQDGAEFDEIDELWHARGSSEWDEAEQADPVLTAYNEADVRAKEAREQDAEAAAAAEMKRKADAAGEVFQLSTQPGSAGRQQKPAVSGGQTGLFDAAAHEAATSPHNDLPEPTAAQKEAGNYKMGHVRVSGLEISIENPRGSVRRGTSPDGTEWQNTLGAHYGYVRRTEGADGDHVDVFVGDAPDSTRVWVIDQVNADGSFDEHKALIGFSNRVKAVNAYKASYSRGWRVGPITEMTMDEFRAWLQGDTTKPLSPELRRRRRGRAPMMESPKGRYGSDRARWPADFPRAPFAADLGEAQKHPDYEAAKGGDFRAAARVVVDVARADRLEAIRKALAGRRPLVVPVVGQETTGTNMIPRAYAEWLAAQLGLQTGTGIVQSARAHRTGKGSDYRLGVHAVFDGAVEAGREYLIVDDTMTMGGTLANLRGHIEANGGRVILASALTGYGSEGVLALSRSMRDAIWSKHGQPLDDYLRETVGFGIDELTQGEAGHFRKAASLDAIRDRIAAARGSAGLDVAEKPLQDDGPVRFSENVATPAEREPARRDRPAAEARGDAGDEGSVPRWRALGIAERIDTGKPASLVGRRIRDAGDLAELGQVYRNPRYEVTRLVFTRGAEVVHTSAVTARIPGAAPIFPGDMSWARGMAWIRGQMESAGADGYWLMHNHPSGDPTPSDADIRATRSIAAEIKGFRGHVIINSNKYAVIDAGGHQQVVTRHFGEDQLLRASKPSAYLGRTLTSPQAVASLGKSLQVDGWITLVGQSGRSGIRAIADVNLATWSRPGLARAAVTRFARTSGSNQVWAYGSTADLRAGDVAALIELGYLDDAVDEQGRSARLTGDIQPRPGFVFGRNPGGVEITEIEQGSAEQSTERALSKLGLKPAQRRTLATVIGQHANRDWRTLWNQLRARAYEGWVDGLIGIRRAEESLGKGIGAGDFQASGYVGARLASGLADLMHGILFYGAPEWRGGVVGHRAGTRGLLDVLGQLEGQELNQWLAWMGANRAEELMGQGRENNLTEADIEALKSQATGKESRFEQVRQQYIAINRAMLDMAEQAGLIDPSARTQWESDWYVPFYRMSEADGEAALLGPTTRRGLSHQSSGIRALKGSEIATNDLLENIITNWLKLADASLKNEALRRTTAMLAGTEFVADESMRWQKVVVPRAEIVKQIEGDRTYLKYWAEAMGLDAEATALEVVHELNALDKSGYESLWHRVAPTDKDIVRVMDAGKAKYFRVNDPALLRALTQVRGDRVDNVLLAAGRWAKRLLTTGVTSSPEFILRNFIRDAAHAWAINPDGFRFGVDSIKGLQRAFQEDEDYRALMFAGASFQGGYVHGTDPEASAQIIRRALEKRGMTERQIEGHLATVVNSAGKAKDMLVQGWQRYREVGDRIENANRLATFKAALAAGKPLAQAVFEAKDLMDYSRRGNMAAAAFFVDVIPFLNARLQGLDKLVRAGADHTAIVGAALVKIALWSALLAWLNDDNDDYKALPDWEKDAYWHLYFGQDHWRIPKPFEIGFLAGTIPERMWHAWVAETQPDDKVLWSLTHGIMETLNFNPIPQGVLPVAEVVANRSFYFGTPIEGMRDERLLPEARYDAFTSETAVVVGKALGLSPKRIEHLWKGYTGTMGGYALSLADMLTRGATDAPPEPELRAGDMVLIRTLYRGREVPRNTQYMTDFYDRLQEVEALHATARQYAKEGDRAGARAIVEENREKLKQRKMLTGTAKALSDLRKREQAILEDRTMPPGEKRLKLSEISRRKNELTRRAAERTEEAF